MKIAVVSLGFVGLPLYLEFGRSGVEISGPDIDLDKLETINAATGKVWQSSGRGLQ